MNTENMLGLLSRTRPSPATSADPIVSRVIRLSRLRTDQGPALALLKVARDLRGATELRTQRHVLAEIASQPGLDAHLRELLPRVLDFDERFDATVSVESYRPGMNMDEMLAREPHRVEELTAAALTAIAPLHQATARLIVVDNICSVKQWVFEPLEDLTRACGRLDARLTPALERLESILTRALVGRRVTVSWTHGDYTPGNVRMPGPQAPVHHIVGWKEARGDRLPLIDLYLMILTASCQAEGVSLGAVVSDRLQAGGLTDSERTALNAGYCRSGADGGEAERVDERLAILLAWLHHVAMSCRDDAGRPEHDAWLAANLAPVLGFVAGWGGFDASGGPTDTQLVHV
jgi:hypothetical protein